MIGENGIEWKREGWRKRREGRGRERKWKRKGRKEKKEGKQGSTQVEREQRTIWLAMGPEERRASKRHVRIRLEGDRDKRGRERVGELVMTVHYEMRADGRWEMLRCDVAEGPARTGRV